MKEIAELLVALTARKRSIAVIAGTRRRRARCKQQPGQHPKSDAAWRGAVAGNDPAFVTFDTPEHGIKGDGKGAA